MACTAHKCLLPPSHVNIHAIESRVHHRSNFSKGADGERCKKCLLHPVSADRSQASLNAQGCRHLDVVCFLGSNQVRSMSHCRRLLCVRVYIIYIYIYIYISQNEPPCFVLGMQCAHLLFRAMVTQKLTHSSHQRSHMRQQVSQYQQPSGALRPGGLGQLKPCLKHPWQ